MGFPYFSPLYPWAIDTMYEREDNPHMAAFRTPFVVMTSAALVTKVGAEVAEPDEEVRKKRIKDAIDGKGKSPTYRGCIISNNINNLDLSYSKNETIVGVDFDGTLIKVEGETGRKVSTPIIESVDVDTDGANNALKVVKVAVTCFTLKQLEMFELFFMKPGMNLLVEWGDSSLIKSDNIRRLHDKAPQSEKRIKNTYTTGEKLEVKQLKSAEDCLIYKTDDYETFCKEFSNYYRSDTPAIAKALQKKEQSNGTYDMIAGKVTGYTFSINQDGTYTCNIDISSGNQISLAIPHNTRSKQSKDGRTPQQEETKFDTTEQIIQRIVADFNLNDRRFRTMITEHPEEGGKWENDWFNFVKINKEQKDTVASDVPYVSFRFVLKILMNYVLAGDGGFDDKFFKFEIQKWKNDKGKEFEIIPVTSNDWIMASNDAVIYPRMGMPVLKAPRKNAKGKIPEGVENEVSLASDPNNNCKIGGYDFHTTQKLFLPKQKDGTVEKQGDPEQVMIGPPEYNVYERVGNALNIFIKYELVVKAWKSTYTRIDFLDKILGILNNNSYGLFMLIYGCRRDTEGATVVDYKIAPDNIKLQNSSQTYRFKPTTLNSIVKQFSFNFEMSNLIAGRTVFNSGKLIAELKKDKKVLTQELPANAYKSVDNSTFGNADGFYSINNVELKRIEQNWKDAIEDDKDENKNKVKKEEGEEATTEPENMDDVIKNKSIQFLIDEKVNKNKKTLIYQDSTIFQDKITKTINGAKKKKPSLSTIDVSITIDGFSGFVPGQYFRIDGIPEIYNKVGVFQITNTKHNISKDGWTTTVEASHRVVDFDE
jgi:hypothetical protein